MSITVPILFSISFDNIKDKITNEICNAKYCKKIQNSCQGATKQLITKRSKIFEKEYLTSHDCQYN